MTKEKIIQNHKPECLVFKFNLLNNDECSCPPPDKVSLNGECEHGCRKDNCGNCYLEGKISSDGEEKLPKTCGYHVGLLNGVPCSKCGLTFDCLNSASPDGESEVPYGVTKWMNTGIKYGYDQFWFDKFKKEAESSGYERGVREAIECLIVKTFPELESDDFDNGYNQAITEVRDKLEKLLIGE